MQQAGTPPGEREHRCQGLGWWQSVSFDYTSAGKRLNSRCVSGLASWHQQGSALRSSRAQSDDGKQRWSLWGVGMDRMSFESHFQPNPICESKRGEMGTEQPEGWAAAGTGPVQHPSYSSTRAGRPGVSGGRAGGQGLVARRCQLGHGRAIYARAGRAQAGSGWRRAAKWHGQAFCCAQRKVLGSAAGHGAGERLPALPALCRM